MHACMHVLCMYMSKPNKTILYNLTGRIVLTIIMIHELGIPLKTTIVIYLIWWISNRKNPHFIKVAIFFFCHSRSCVPATVPAAFHRDWTLYYNKNHETNKFSVRNNLFHCLEFYWGHPATASPCHNGLGGPGRTKCTGTDQQHKVPRRFSKRVIFLAKQGRLPCWNGALGNQCASKHTQNAKPYYMQVIYGIAGETKPPGSLEASNHDSTVSAVTWRNTIFAQLSLQGEIFPFTSSDHHGDKLFVTVSDISPESIYGIYTFSDILFSGIHSSIPSGIYSDNLSDMGIAGPQPQAPDLSGQCPVRSGARGWSAVAH